MACMWCCRPASNSWIVVGGYGSPLTFLVSATKIESHLFKLSGAMSSKSISRHFSSLHSFLSVIWDLRFSKAHFVDDSVFWAHRVLSNSSFKGLEKWLFFAGGAWGRTLLNWGWGCSDVNSEEGPGQDLHISWMGVLKWSIELLFTWSLLHTLSLERLNIHFS